MNINAALNNLRDEFRKNGLPISIADRTWELIHAAVWDHRKEPTVRIEIVAPTASCEKS